MKFPLKLTLSFLAGATFFCTLSLILKGPLESSPIFEGLLIPFLIGGLSGSLIYLREKRLRKEIQSRIQAKEKLRGTIEKFKTLTNHLHVGYYRNTPGGKGQFIQVNTSIVKMFGYDHIEELMAIPVIDLYQDPDERKKVSVETLHAGMIKNRILRLKKKDGTLLIGSVSARTVKNNKGEVEYFDGIIEDVTEREHISEELRKSEKRYKDLFNSITDLVFTQDLKGRFTSANSAMYTLFEYNLEGFIGRSPKDFMKPTLAPKFEGEYLEQIKKNGYINGISSYLRKDGGIVYLEFRSALVEPEEGPAFISGIARDVTERIVAEKKITELQDQMIQAQKMEAIGTLAGGIAHDFNNILSAVIGYTELALVKVEKKSHLHKSLTEVLHAGNRAADLVKQILTFSRQAGLEVKPFYLNPLVREVLKMLRSTIPTSIEIKENISNDFLTIDANPTQIHQVVVNLVTNASHAVDIDSGFIKIELNPFVLDKNTKEIPTDLAPGKYAKLTISDNGSGISKAHINQIFDPYFTTKEKHKGTGLGLSVVHGIIKSYKGQITVSSKVDQGTVFDVYFPLSDQKVLNTVTDRDGPLPTGKEHILLVDDEPTIVALYKEILKQLGYTVTGRTSSTEALEMFRSSPDKYDLVITDMAMPKISGDRLTREIKKIRPDIPVVLCTGFSEKLNPLHTSQMDIDEFLMKPVDKTKMAVAIRKSLDNRCHDRNSLPCEFVKEPPIEL